MFLISKLLKEDICYYKNISLAECENQNTYLYFWGQCYVS